MPYDKDQFRARMSGIERAEREAAEAWNTTAMQIVYVVLVCCIIGLAYMCLKWSSVLS